MLISECIKCGKQYKEIKNDKRIVEITHGYCPKCLEEEKEKLAKRKKDGTKKHKN